MTFAAAVGPLVAYAATFQTIIFFLLPSRLRTAWAPVTIGSVGAGITVTAGALFGFERIGLGTPEPDLVMIWAVATFACVSLVATTMLFSRRLRPRLADHRITDMGRRQAVVHFAFRIPILTALIEEAFFRGVLHAALTSAYSTPVAAVVGAGLFGIWHLGPALDQAEANRYNSRSTTIHILMTVAVTTVAGFGFVALRIATGSIWIPAVVHAVLNVTMAVFVRIAARRRTSVTSRN